MLRSIFFHIFLAAALVGSISRRNTLYAWTWLVLFFTEIQGEKFSAVEHARES